MIDRLLHTPDGVRDILDKECARKQVLEKHLQKVFSSYGYKSLETPTFEFFDVFGREVGTTPSRELYKFFDHEGNTLVLRPDFTPSIARAAAKYYHDETMPVRLCYQGKTYINNVSYQGHLKESTQMGAEFIGEDSAQADAEMIALSIDLLLRAGLTEFQVSIGHVDFFKGLMKEAGLTENEEQSLRSLIAMKNYFGAEEYLKQFHLRPDLEQALTSLPELFGNGDILKKARDMTMNKEAVSAVDRLEEIYRILSISGLEKYVSFDLGMLNKYRYYTGVIFRGYTFGTGDAVVKGGRYDHLLARFGKPSPSIGVGLVIDRLLNALARQKIEILPEDGPVLVLYEKADQEEAMKEARLFRMEGNSIVLMEKKEELDVYEAYGKRNGFSKVRIFSAERN